MSVPSTANLITTDELLAMPEDGMDRELIRGVLKEVPMTRRSRLHARTEANVAHMLKLWMDRQSEPRGEVLSGEADHDLDTAIRWAALNLDEAMACNPDLGCGLVAGYGPSESRGARPGFGWYFGGDASINSMGLDALGQYDLARQGLEFFIRYQRSDGKIAHEISQSAGRIKWFDDIPYAYYHADTTPFWIVAVWRYWRASGDTVVVRELWPAIISTTGLTLSGSSYEATGNVAFNNGRADYGFYINGVTLIANLTIAGSCNFGLTGLVLGAVREPLLRPWLFPKNPFCRGLSEWLSYVQPANQAS